MLSHLYFTQSLDRIFVIPDFLNAFIYKLLIDHAIIFYFTIFLLDFIIFKTWELVLYLHWHFILKKYMCILQQQMLSYTYWKEKFLSTL